MLVTYMKTSSLETAINSESAYSAPYTLTTTGLNDVIIQKQPKRKKKQPKGCGFVANFGAEKRIELRYHVLNVRNFRVKDNNATLMCNMDINIKFIVFDKDEEKVALDVNQVNSKMFFHIENQGAGVFNADVDSYTIGKPVVLESALGQPPMPERDANDTSPAPEPRKNKGLNIHKIHAFLTKMKPTVIE